MAVSSRKQVWQLMGTPRSAFSKRVNASSGGLHPVEGYAILPPLKNVNNRASVYHYSPKEHGLEKRTEFSEDVWKKLTGNLPENSFFVAFTSVNWREIWKYGERGFRYAQLDIGHAFSSCRMAAAMLGWSMQIITDISDESLSNLLGLKQGKYINKLEAESPAVLAVMVPYREVKSGGKFEISSDLLSMIDQGKWFGAPNIVSVVHTDWEIVSAVTSITVDNCKDSSVHVFSNPKRITSDPHLFELTKEVKGGHVIRNRRSALDMSPKMISKQQFLQCIARVVPSITVVPWDLWELLPTSVNIGVYVYRVEGITPGFYMLIRDPDQLDQIKKATKDRGFKWEHPSEISEKIPLYFLEEETSIKLGKEAALSSCNQNIVSEGAFCLSMFVNLQPLIEKYGPAMYRKVHWEAGMIGQVLYNEPHALGLKATGLGCFLDERSAKNFGLEKSSYKVLYNFTIGNAIEDMRFPPYSYEQEMYSFKDQEDQEI